MGNEYEGSDELSMGEVGLSCSHLWYLDGVNTYIGILFEKGIT